MILSIIKNIKKQLLFFLVYAVFLVFLVVILFKYSKIDATLWANQYWSPFQDYMYKYMTYLGDFWMASLVVLVLLFWKFKYAVIAIVSFGTTALITQFLKKIIYYDVKRPLIEMWEQMHDGTLHTVVDEADQLINYSFPSGHTTSAFSIFCILALLRVFTLSMCLCSFVTVSFHSRSARPRTSSPRRCTLSRTVAGRA